MDNAEGPASDGLSKLEFESRFSVASYFDSYCPEHQSSLEIWQQIC